MTVFLMVRAHLTDMALKADFDRWYQEEHLRDALAAFKAKRAHRGWSQTDKSVHYALYEFPDLAQAESVQGSEQLKRLAAEFDHCWGDKVVRSRDIVELVQSVDA